jgi:thymidylate kinase
MDLERARFHEKIRAAFLVLATKEPGRIKVVDGRLGRPEAAEAVHRHVTTALDRRAR